MKTTYVAILALALPVGLVAQQPSGAAPANPVTTVFRTRTMGLQRNIAQAFDSIPAAKFSYKPTPAQLSIGYIAQHLVSDNYFFCNNFGSMKGAQSAADTTTADSVKATVAEGHAGHEAQGVSQVLRGRVRPARRCEAGGSDHHDVRWPIAERTRASMVLGHALDLADHYSQLANYMRLNNILPPSALPRPPRPGDN